MSPAVYISDIFVNKETKYSYSRHALQQSLLLSMIILAGMTESSTQIILYHFSPCTVVISASQIPSTVYSPLPAGRKMLSPFLYPTVSP